MTDPRNIILAIESAICGGSISLLWARNEIAHWIGTSSVSKAEDLLFNIDALLKSNNIFCNDIGLIAVSAGPGSFTGIRIGLATAFGLKAGLGIKMSSESALKAMVFTQRVNATMTAAVPMGRNSVCLQSFKWSERNVIAMDQPQTLPEASFAALIQNSADTEFVVHTSLYQKFDISPRVTNFGANIAYSIGFICGENADMVTEPLFVSKSF